jgi:nitrite reductase (NADH) large subunit
MNVTCGQLAAACARDTSTVESLVADTGASTLCGSCRPLLEQFVGADAAAPARIARGLLVTSAVALAIAVALFVAAPAPFAPSVQDPWMADVLWRSGTYRQVSGFVLLGLSLMASLLSVRKRWWRAASAGPFTAWRLAHVAIGALTLVALAMHTGARAGDNLNLALMASFGALNVLGGLAGGVTALEQRLRARAGARCRAAVAAAHILAIWPLPLLVAFHVLSVYYF